MRKNIVAGNWKMNTTVPQGVALAKEVAQKANEVKDAALVIAPPFTHLASVAEAIKGSSIALSAQNCADHTGGAYTGEVSADMIESVGCSYCILGHSERRQYYGETDQALCVKIKLVLDKGIKPILCVGENLEEREAGKHFSIVESQIKNVLYTLSENEMKNVVVAYEPVWAIGTGKTASADQAQEIHACIRKCIADKFGPAIAEDTTILYGGSCKPSNAKELFAMKDIDGGLIGGAALKADDFIAIATSF